MRASAVALVLMLALAACGGSTPAAAHTPVASASGATETPSAAPSATASAAPTAPTSLVRCTKPVPAGDNLVIGTVTGDPTVVVRDIQDPANAKNLCTLDGTAQAPQFVSATSVAYETPDRQIVKADVAGGAATLVATYGAGFDSGEYAFSPDGRSVTYIDGNEWRLSGPNGNRVLTTMPAAPGRGVSLYQDDSFLGFSPDGQYIAFFQTFRVGGSGSTAPDQIRRAGDGSLVYSTSGMTMAVWASVPSRLFFRDSAGNVKRWDASAGVSAMTTATWVRPRSSPDGRWIAYAFPTSAGVGTVGLYSVQANSITNTSPAGRSGVRFLTNDLIWYAGERACSTCFGGQPQPTGVSYIYSVAGASEVSSRLSAVYDSWPHTTAPAL